MIPRLRRSWAYLPIRWHLRIGPSVSDDTIETCIGRWRWRFGGDTSAFADLFGALLDVLGPASVRSTFLAAADGPHPPATWWDE